MAPALVFLWAAAVNPCVVPDQPAARDRVRGALYLQIGDDELAAGHRDTAVVAYQDAARSDRNGARARAALARLCHEGEAPSGPASDGFEEALALMKAGRRREAAALFETVRVQENETAAALLEGVCLYELGDSNAARPLLRQAAGDPALAESAAVFLGLVALRADDGDQADGLVRAIAASPASPLRQAAVEIMRAARSGARDNNNNKRWMASLLSEIGYDSNVALTPDGSLLVPSSHDGSASETAGALWQPFQPSGPYGRAAAQYRKQFSLSAYDLGNIGGAVGWRQGRGGTFAVAEYSYDFFTLGNARYLSAHRLAAEAHWRIARAVSLTITAFARFESFLQDQTADYSGMRLFAEAELAAHPTADVTAACRYHGAHDDTHASFLTYWEHGPTCGAWWMLSDRGRLFVEGAAMFRRYAAPDPLLALDRRDRFLDALAGADWDLGAHWTLRLVGTGRKATSTVPDYTYSRFSVTAGALYGWAGP